MATKNISIAIAFIVAASYIGFLYVSDSGQTPNSHANSPATPVSRPNSIQKSVAPPLNAETLVGRQLSIRLSGIVGGRNGLPLAILSVDGAKDAIFRVGDSLVEGSVVTAIADDSITYRRGTENVIVNMQWSKNGGVSVGSAPVAPSAKSELTQSGEPLKYPGFMPMSIPTQSAGIQTPNDNSQFKQDIEKKIAAMKQTN